MQDVGGGWYDEVLLIGGMKMPPGRNKMWALRKPILDARILLLQEKIQELEQEIDELVMEKLS